MKMQSTAQLWRSLITPVFLMTMFLLPLLFILVKRYFSFELIPFSLVNGFIMTGGMLLNIFVFRQLSGKISNLIIYILIVITSAGFAFSGLIYITINHPLFFLYGLEVMISYIAITFIIITSLSLFSSGFFNYQEMVEEERQKREREKILREETERQMHSARINPHFLFNSLNLMVSLLDDREKAEEVLIGLSDLLRFNLDVSKKKEIPLSLELEIIKKYLFIQKERFGARLEYEIQGDSPQMIPPLLLQPLVENSIKHNLDESDYVKITITIESNEEGLVLGIMDSYKLLKEEMIGTGTGLEVTKQRVLLSGGTFHIKNGGIEICLPRR
ncbi:MAG: histidine kinase [Spirochaetaceae bacterium]|nr:histidine kinase [Spirochaetaceae bacterium]